jgi:TRAP transporter 4TM/12TM fusion protein
MWDTGDFTFRVSSAAVKWSRSMDGSGGVDPAGSGRPVEQPPASSSDGQPVVAEDGPGAEVQADEAIRVAVLDSTGDTALTTTADRALSAEAAAQLAAQFEEEKPGRVLGGRLSLLISTVAVGVGLLVLWQLFVPLAQGSQYYLILFLSGVLPLVFLSYASDLRLPARWLPERWRRPTPRTDRPTPLDWVLAVLALAVCLYPVLPVGVGGAGGGYDQFLDRQGLLNPVDTVLGAVLLLLILEACRRTTGWVLPLVCVLFIGYAYYGGYLPQGWSIAHAGLDFGQVIDALYNSGSGFYGTPLDVAASYIVLFTIYGAVLDLSGAGAFFVDLSVAAFRTSRSAAGRTAVAAGFLLGTVSGSGAATTVSVGAVTWPILRRAGYPAERAGGMLAAAGVGAILSPPTLGAAAFIIAEYLDVSYLKVLLWATVPTLLYYLGILLAVEIDARRFGVRQVAIETRSPWKLLARFGYHFSSLIVIVVFLAFGLSATRAVVYATLLTAVLSYLDRRHWLTPRRLFEALAAGIRGVLPVAAVCAAAGVITAVTTKTGLGPQTAALLVDGAKAVSDNPTVVAALTAVFAAVALTLLGLAVPVTASFIIGWVVIGPALIHLGVSTPAAAMFVFYFAVLSEATPPTALASVAAAAVTGGRIIPTMWQTLRYALPAYLVPLAFVLTPAGEGLLGRGGVGQVAFALAASALGVAALAVAAGGWLPGVGPARAPERILAAAAGLALLWLDPIATAVGAALAAGACVVCVVRRRLAEPAALSAADTSREETQ